MTDRHSGTYPPEERQKRLSKLDLMALPCMVELLPIVGVLAFLRWPSVAAAILVLVMVSGLGWLMSRRLLAAAVSAALRFVLVLGPFYLLAIRGDPLCEGRCTWQSGTSWHLWLAVLFVQPLLSAAMLAIHFFEGERRLGTS